jgi:hypothetical protein
MRVLLHVKLPHEPFNSLVKAGTVGAKMQRILQEQKPEAAYFTEYGGRRGGILIINVDNASQVPSFAEPWFLTFNADCEFHIVMTPDDLAKAGLDDLGKKWS